MRSGEVEKGRCLPWSKEEEGEYIFLMKQVPVYPPPIFSLKLFFFFSFYIIWLHTRIIKSSFVIYPLTRYRQASTNDVKDIRHLQFYFVL
jgi:hypothetical protein